MRGLISVIIILYFFGCNIVDDKNKSDKTEKYIYTTDLDVLDINGKSANFEVIYTFTVLKNSLSASKVSSIDELNDLILLPIIRSEIRLKFGKISLSQVDQLNSKELMEKINQNLEQGVFINSERVSCNTRLKNLKIREIEKQILYN